MAVLLFEAGLGLGSLLGGGQASVDTLESCRDALEVDNDIFSNVGSRISSLDISGATDYLDSRTDERLRLHNECMAN